jgi:HEPN domain-containing protein
LAIAKELYLHGLFHSKRDSPSDRVLSILNFDYCAETIVKAVLLDLGISLEERRGIPKTFPRLIQDLRQHYGNLRFVDEVDSLHNLRNNVQHNADIPSAENVTRHNTTVRAFFDEICSQVYSGQISFDRISLAPFVTSQIEKEYMLKEMEKAFQDSRFSDAFYYAKQAAYYHVRLLRYNLGVPERRGISYFTFQDLKKYGLEKLIEILDEFEKSLDWITDRIILQEYHTDVMELFKGGFFTAERLPASRDEAENAKNTVYNFIIGTQWLVKTPDLPYPAIYDLVVIEKTETGCKIQVGLASISEITYAEARISGRETGRRLPPIAVDIPKQNGLHVLPISGLEKGNSYYIDVYVKNRENPLKENEEIIFQMS